MLKKAGIVVAAAAAALLAVSPLAFAGDKGYEGHDGGDVTTVASHNLNDNLNDNKFGNGVGSGNNVSVPVNVCDIQANALGVQVPFSNSTAQVSDLLGGLNGVGILGEGKSKAEDSGTDGGVAVDDSCRNEVGQVSGDNGSDIK